MSANVICDLVSVKTYDAVKKLQSEHTKWISASGSQELPPLTFWDALDDVVEAAEQGNAVFFGPHFVQSITKLIEAKQRFDDEDIVDPPQWFWSAVQGVFMETEKAERLLHTTIVVESIQSLEREGVPRDQIAEIYGFMSPTGVPLRHKIDEEIRTPGSVVGDQWVHPREKYRLERLKNFKAAMDAYYNGELDEEAEEFKPCAESWLELYQLEVDVRQAATMKGVTIADAQKEYDSLAKLAQNANKPNPEQFKFPKDDPEPQPVETDSEPDVDDQLTERLNQMTSKELREYATQLGIAFDPGILPKNLIKRIKKVASEQEMVK